MRVTTCQNAGNQDLPFRSWSTSSPGGKSEVPAMSSGDAPELNLPNVDFPPKGLQHITDFQPKPAVMKIDPFGTSPKKYRNGPRHKIISSLRAKVQPCYLF